MAFNAGLDNPLPFPIPPTVHPRALSLSLSACTSFGLCFRLANKCHFCSVVTSFGEVRTSRTLAHISWNCCWLNVCIRYWVVVDDTKIRSCMFACRIIGYAAFHRSPLLSYRIKMQTAMLLCWFDIKTEFIAKHTYYLSLCVCVGVSVCT